MRAANPYPAGAANQSRPPRRSPSAQPPSFDTATALSTAASSAPPAVAYAPCCDASAMAMKPTPSPFSVVPRNFAAGSRPQLTSVKNVCSATQRVAYTCAPAKCSDTYGSSPTTQLSCGSGGM